MINYLFYRFSQLKIYRPTYLAKIFVPVIVAIAFLPSSITLSKYFFGCYDQNKYDGTVKIIILVTGFIAMLGINHYYSPDKVRQLSEKYSQESKLQGNLKLVFICLLFHAILLYGSDVIRILIEVPQC
jgi:uncharacterized membrane protein YidH (DUF202 family)